MEKVKINTNKKRNNQWTKNKNNQKVIHLFWRFEEVDKKETSEKTDEKKEAEGKEEKSVEKKGKEDEEETKPEIIELQNIIKSSDELNEYGFISSEEMVKEKGGKF